ncbi:hypothetical protein M427DRAFT_140897 [Gonapodya prolifera JEL478]|uniref:Uncharacterized protein n=1 Tax=Gonapodya prolifera (strain JEL478) TaxID=1344416 RepID=A0A138ZY78_GONPJ|nr:hypothetical protein M427DRAFT_140897 [Gonapodya prolifera JEL478]|eukprot:KXS09444.1 hypothetical protein M427DRAFT_140897 [Gonapodya prolifera JEL478]
MARYVSKQILGCELEIWEDKGHLTEYFDEFEQIIAWARNRENASTSPGQSTAE